MADSIETIPIPTDKASNKEPIHIEVDDLDAWPNQNFRFRFEWNSVMKKWIVEMEHEDLDEVFVTAPVCLMREYNYADYLYFVFIDPSTNADEVTPDNLGDNVLLSVWEGRIE